MAEDERVNLLSFTGSTKVSEDICLNMVQDFSELSKNIAHVVIILLHLNQI